MPAVIYSSISQFLLKQFKGIVSKYKSKTFNLAVNDVQWILVFLHIKRILKKNHLNRNI